MENKSTYTNSLTNQTSPYLLQHAHNPVHWHPWGLPALQIAKLRDKPLLISIGYAACHWCHVMAHQTFEDIDSARIMNENFICVKVDREERPDVDKAYMQAVQAMTGTGGWPLHVFALPDGRPFYGGTYFPKDRWQQLCLAIAQEYQRNRNHLNAYAENLEKGLQRHSYLTGNQIKSDLDQNSIRDAVREVSIGFDQNHGGMLGAPKFPMPALLGFLLNYSILEGNKGIYDHVLRTLNHMAMGGIYDHVGGGFARYSVDAGWKVPHFEKMLYDNAQLLTLYSRAFRREGTHLYRERVQETANFLLTEMRTPQGLFASSIDADSEGAEGKYYVWEKEELEDTLGDQYPIAKKVFNINTFGLWEDGKYILHLREDFDTLSESLKISKNDLLDNIKHIKEILRVHRQDRARPGLDHKCLTSWNGLAIQGLAEAYLALRDPFCLEAAKTAARFLIEHALTSDGGLFHVMVDGKPHTIGFLEDYSHLITGLIALYQAEFEERWIEHAKDLMLVALDHFQVPNSSFLYFSPETQENFIKRDIELTDSVIPSANSAIAHQLFILARYLELPEWEARAKDMVSATADAVIGHPGNYSHWADAYLMAAFPFDEIAVTGPDAFSVTQKMQSSYLPNRIYAASNSQTSLPILSDRFNGQQNSIYLCRDKVCGLPYASYQEYLRENPPV